jgi:hypothetical protein
MMKNETTSSVEALMKFVVQRIPGQKEFQQAVEDVAQDIIPWLSERQTCVTTCAPGILRRLITGVRSDVTQELNDVVKTVVKKHQWSC